MRRVFVVCAVLMGTSSALAQVNPSASYSFFPKTAKTGEDVAFYGNTSYSLDGALVEYDWDFGDGTTETGPIAHHQFTELSNFPVTLTVTDSNGMTATHLQHVAVPLEGPGVIRLTPASARQRVEQVFEPTAVLPYRSSCHSSQMLPLLNWTLM